MTAQNEPGTAHDDCPREATQEDVMGFGAGTAARGKILDSEMHMPIHTVLYRPALFRSPQMGHVALEPTPLRNCIGVWASQS